MALFHFVLTAALIGSAVAEVAHITSTAQLASLKKVPAVVAQLPSASGPVYDALTTAASEMDPEIKFGVVTDPALFDGGDTVVMYKPHDAPREVFSGDPTVAEEILTFGRHFVIPLFGEITEHTFSAYAARDLRVIGIFCRKDDAAAHGVGRAVASRFYRKLSIGWIDATEHAAAAVQVGVNVDRLPALVILTSVTSGRHIVYPVGRPFTVVSIEEYLEDFLAGRLEGHSDAPPDEHTVHGLTTVVGSTFDELVTKANEDVFLLLYSPWCDRCKALLPVFAELAQSVAGGSLRTARMDATTNDYPHERIKAAGLPAMYFLSHQTKEFEHYDGNEDVESMRAYITAKTG